MPANYNNNRRKRIKNTLSRLKRGNRELRAKAAQYRKTAFLSGAVAVVLALILGFMVVREPVPDPVTLGEGPAGVMTSEMAQRLDSLRQADSLRVAGALAEAARKKQTQAAQARGADAGSGLASYYGTELEGEPTASGEGFNPAALTAAHRTLPFGSRVRVTNVRNGKSVIVRINDRGPFSGNRVIDLSHAAARSIGMLKRGTARVRIELMRSS